MTTTIPCPPPPGCAPLGDDSPPAAMTPAQHLALALWVLRDIEYIRDSSAGNYKCPECGERPPTESNPLGHLPTCALYQAIRGSW